MNEIKRDGKIEQDVTSANESNVILQNGGYHMHTFSDVKEIYFAYIHDEKDRKMIENAYNFVKKKHDGIFRKSGEPYLQHLIEVAYIVASLQGGPTTIAAAFLHDVVEDTDTSIEDIKRMFGEDCARIVDALTKIQRLKLSHRTEEEFAAEDHKKIFLGMAKDVRVIIIKLADRLHNMRTVKALRPERQHALAKDAFVAFMTESKEGLQAIAAEGGILTKSVASAKSWSEIATSEFPNLDIEGVTINACGSTSVENVLSGLASAFKEATGCTVTPNQTGSGDAVPGVTGEGSTQYEIGFLSREIEADERASLTEANKNGPICKDAVVPIVNAANTTVTNSTAEALAAAYKGEITTWSEFAELVA